MEVQQPNLLLDSSSNLAAQEQVTTSPLVLSSIAGASTCLGAAIVFCHGGKTVSSAQLSFSLALAGSVMATVSVVSIGPECLRQHTENDDSYQLISLWSWQFLHRCLSFLAGCALYKLLSWTFPEPDDILTLPQRTDDEDDDEEQSIISSTSSTTAVSSDRRSSPRARRRNEKDVERVKQSSETTREGNKKTMATTTTTLSWKAWSTGADLGSNEARRSWRVAMLLFVSLLFHNFPEGLAVAASALESQKLGVVVAIGIMIHNIPEGIAISIPCLAARPDQPWLAFWLASVSGLAEPLGAFVALLFLRQDSSLNLDNVLAFVAGIMIAVAMSDLFPEALRKGETAYFVFGTICGVLVMVTTEVYLS